MEGPFFTSDESCRMASHMYAVESGAFVLVTTAVQTAKGLEANGFLDLGTESADDKARCAGATGGCFSTIIAPVGKGLTPRTDPSWQDLLYQELDFNEIYKVKAVVDVVGHYSRPDIFRLHVNSTSHPHVVDGSLEGGLRHIDRLTDLQVLDAKNDPQRLRETCFVW